MQFTAIHAIAKFPSHILVPTKLVRENDRLAKSINVFPSSAAVFVWRELHIGHGSLL